MSFPTYIKSRSRKLVLLAFDHLCLVLMCALYGGVCALTDMALPAPGPFLLCCLILWASLFIARFAFKSYSNIWRYTDSSAYFRLVVADVTGGACALVLAFLLKLCTRNTAWLFLVIASLNLILTLMSRFTYRLLYKKKKNGADDENSERIPVAIVGAGQLGAQLAGDTVCVERARYEPVFFIDRDQNKVGGLINGIAVYAEDNQLPRRLRDKGVQEIIVAINGIDGEKLLELYDYYSALGYRIKLYDNTVKDPDESGDNPYRSVRDFSIEDLLFRRPVTLNGDSTHAFYRDKTVLVTGGGGSIGSELCRQIAACSPKKLIILDIYENNAYEIQQELHRTHKTLDLVVEIASVRDRDRMDAVFAHYRPQVVFHAAAHKHVPLMEHSAGEAIKNNVLGTKNTADMAEKYGTDNFILISTDKAVNPTNVMGASKRICEMIVQSRTDSHTCFAAVRFGNVLGSNGSVIPLFKRQIASGGPVTVTDKRIIRYFMTISEASQLVMEAGAMAKNGELFVLDMGKPVRIYDLAVNMIRLSGFEPNVDIKIEEIGLRPGEKLYEELLMKTETLTKTDNSRIFIETDTPLPRQEVEDKLSLLASAVALWQSGQDHLAVKKAMKETVPTFCEPDEVNRTAECSAEMQSYKQIS